MIASLLARLFLGAHVLLYRPTGCRVDGRHEGGMNVLLLTTAG